MANDMCHTQKRAIADSQGEEYMVAAKLAAGAKKLEVAHAGVQSNCVYKRWEYDIYSSST